MSEAQDPSNPERRSFLKESLCVVIGGVVTMVPFAAGVTFWLNPLRKKASTGATGSPVRVAPLSALPGDGIPRKFPVIASRIDAWNRYPQTPIGAVYLIRKDDKNIKAFNVVCPHAGCFVDYVSDRNSFSCPCHNSTFALDGSINDPKSPSPRGLDELKVEVRGEEVFVAFQNFRAGIHERIPES